MQTRTQDTQRTAAGRASAPGFSMIELAVIVAIIAAVTGLFLLAQSRAKVRAVQAVCMRNVQALTLAHLMYVNDTSSLVSYGHQTSEHPPESLWLGNLLGAYLSDPEARFCPSAPGRLEFAGSGNAETAWRRGTDDRKVEGCYAINGWLYADRRFLQPTWAEKQFKAISEVQFPKTTPLFGDSVWIDAWPEEQNPAAVDLYAGGFNEGMMGRFTIARHGIRNPRDPAVVPRDIGDRRLPGSIVIGFADHHVEVVPLENLWSLTWHRTWEAPETRPR